MPSPPLPFKKGDRVRVLSGPFEGEIGVVVQADSMAISDGLYEMVWVQLKEIEGFLPKNLEKIAQQKGKG
jgi:transcription antitermination factor NusG